MARSRKSIDVQSMLTYANNMLAAPDNNQINKSFRMGICCFIERILMDSGNYHGFNYLGWMNGGFQRWMEAGQPEDKTEFIGDESRRVYFGGIK